MQPYRVQTLGFRIYITIDDIGAEHVSRVRVRVSQEIGQSDSGKRVIVVEIALIELHVNIVN